MTPETREALILGLLILGMGSMFLIALVTVIFWWIERQGRRQSEALRRHVESLNTDATVIMGQK